MYVFSISRKLMSTLHIVSNFREVQIVSNLLYHMPSSCCFFFLPPLLYISPYPSQSPFSGSNNLKVILVLKDEFSKSLEREHREEHQFLD
jgi:hypothetical protein